MYPRVEVSQPEAPKVNTKSTLEGAGSPHDRIMESLERLDIAVGRLGFLAERMLREGEAPVEAEVKTSPGNLPIAQLLDYAPTTIHSLCERIEQYIQHIEDMLYGTR
jgi:hypothetical protein